MFKIVDWTGKEMYPGKKFRTELMAWDFLTRDQHKRHPNASEDEFDDIMGEFATVPVE